MHYVAFQRVIALFTSLLVIISTASLAINLSHEDDEKSLLHRTASSNLPKGDAKMWYNVFSSFLIPWIVFGLLQRLRRTVGLMKPDTSSFGKSLMLKPLNMGMLKSLNIGMLKSLNMGKLKSLNMGMLKSLNMGEEQLRSYFAAKFPNCALKSVDFGFSTQVVMQGTLSSIDFHSRVLKVLAARGEEAPTCCQNLLARR